MLRGSAARERGRRPVRDLWLAVATGRASAAPARGAEETPVTKDSGKAGEPPRARRKGGARPGNKHALKNGRSSRDPMFSAMWASLTDEQRKTLYPMVKEQGHLLPTLADYERSLREAGRLTPIEDARRIAAERRERGAAAARHDAHDARPTEVPSTYTDTDRQHDNMTARELAVFQYLMAIGFFEARVFLELHAGALEILERIIDQHQIKDAEDPVASRSIGNRGGLIRRQVHEALMVRVGNLNQCPYCDLQRYIAVKAPAEQKGEKGSTA